MANKNLLNPIPFSLDKFSWNKATGVLVAEASELDGKLFQQIYRDAADVGFAIYSPTTGKTEIFSLESARENDGDTVAWVFKPINKKCRVKTVHVLND